MAVWQLGKQFHVNCTDTNRVAVGVARETHGLAMYDECQKYDRNVEKCDAHVTTWRVRAKRTIVAQVRRLRFDLNGASESNRRCCKDDADIIRLNSPSFFKML